jgi:hypothetical protein
VPFKSWSVSPSASWGRPEFEPGFLPLWWVGFPGWFPSLSIILCATSACQERGSLPQINMVWWHLAGAVIPLGQGCWGSDKEMKTPPSKSWIIPQKYCRRAHTETERAPAFRKQVHWAATQQTCVQRLSPENKGDFPYISFSAGYKNAGGGTACPIHNHMSLHWLL